MPAIAALICGFVFGWGLLISGMMQPAKVLAFLDIFGNWDPSLAVVMAAALAVSGAGFALAKRRGQPLLRRAEPVADQNGYRPAAGDRRGAVRRRLGPRPDCVRDRHWRISRRCRRGSSCSWSPWRPAWSLHDTGRSGGRSTPPRWHARRLRDAGGRLTPTQPPQRHHLAAVDHDGRAGDEAAGVRDQQQQRAVEIARPRRSGRPESRA